MQKQIDEHIIVLLFKIINHEHTYGCAHGCFVGYNRGGERVRVDRLHHLYASEGDLLYQILMIRDEEPQIRNIS